MAHLVALPPTLLGSQNTQHIKAQIWASWKITQGGNWNVLRLFFCRQCIQHSSEKYTEVCMFMTILCLSNPHVLDGQTTSEELVPFG